MGLVVAKYFDNLIDAEMIKSKLHSEGIECFLFNEHLSSIFGVTNPAFKEIKLMVDAVDLERVNEILAVIAKTPITDDNNEIIKCPNCNSQDIIYDYKSIKSNSRMLGFLLSVFSSAFSFFYDTVYKCKQCDAEFTNKTKA